MVWCDPSQLKPFVENFDEISKMNNSKVFRSSVDKAVIELNERVELDLGCSCKSEQGKRNIDRGGMISKFQPGLFLSLVKCLARDGFKPYILEVASVQKLLGSFYRSKEDYQRTEDNLVTVSSRQGHESRERRKSKYLSFPYTDKNKDLQPEPKRAEKKKLNKKKIDGNENSSVFTRDDVINEPPLEMLSNLLKAAVIGHSVSGERCLLGFRTWAFCEKSIFDLHVMETEGAEVEKLDTYSCTLANIRSNNKKPGRKEEISTTISNLAVSVEKDIQEGSTKKKKRRDIAPGSSETSCPLPDISSKMNKQRKKQATIPETSCPLPDISANEIDIGKEEEKPGVIPGFATGFSEMSIDFQTEEGISTTDDKIKQKKRKRNNPRIIPGFVKANINTGLPDLNGNINENQVIESSPGSVFKTFQTMDFSTLQNFLSINQDETLESNQPEIAGNIVQTEEPPKKKKTKKKSNINLSDMNLTYIKLQAEEESIGSALVLKFDQEQPPLPSKEALLAAFSGFGILNESETEVFNETHTAQVIFLNGSEARNAFCSLEKTGPFGTSLITFRLIHLSEPPPKSSEMENARRTDSSPSTSFPIPAVAGVNGLLLQSRPTAVLMKRPQQQQEQRQHNANFKRMKNSLEMMTRMLEKTDNNLSPELRGKLENDIKGLMTRLRSMNGTA
ncbi:serine/threonine-protein kinase ATM-like isoform X2 [Impatiens glandulifera]|nr:serine/threonine-protein kinase ATM-like isoform X2 [Impatiens glandulifera]